MKNMAPPAGVRTPILRRLSIPIHSRVSNSLISSGCIISGTVEDSVIFKKVFVGRNCIIKNSIILNDVYIGDNAIIENCIVESRSMLQPGSCYRGENGVEIVIEKNKMRVT